jgi:hypothetical protein
VQDSRQPVTAAAEQNNFGIRYQVTTIEVTASEDIEDLASVILRSRVRELVRALYLLVVIIYGIQINPITNPNPKFVKIFHCI